MTSIETISVVVAAVGVLIAAVNQIYTTREANKQRQIQLFTRARDDESPPLLLH